MRADASTRNLFREILEEHLRLSISERRVGGGFRASRCIPDRRLNPAQCAGAALRRRRVAEIDQDLGVALRNGVGGNRSRPTTASPVARSNFQAFAARQEPKVRRPFAGERWIRTVGPRLSSATSFWPEFHSQFPNSATVFQTVPATPSVAPLRRQMAYLPVMMSAQSPSAHVALVADLSTSCSDSQVTRH